MRKQYRKRGFTLVELTIVVAIIAIIAAIAVPNLLESRMQANEAAAIGALKGYAIAQTAYKRANYSEANGLPRQSYCPNFNKLAGISAHLKGDGKTRIDLVSGAFAAATTTTTGMQGYYFTDSSILAASEWAYDFALYADPCLYDRTGINTYFIDSKGTVMMRDFGGAASNGSAAVDSTWVVP